MRPRWLEPQTYKTALEIRNMAEGKLESECINDDVDCALSAYDKLEGKEKKHIELSAKSIVEYVKLNDPLRQFDFTDAICLLSKIGILMFKQSERTNSHV